MPVRFSPSTMTFIGRVRTDGRVSTRRGFGDAMMAVAKLDAVVQVQEVFLGGWVDGSNGGLGIERR